MGKGFATANRNLQDFSDVTIGTLVDISDSGKPLVDIPGLPGPLESLTAITFDSLREARNHVGERVLVHAGHNLQSVTILGFIQDSMVAEDRVCDLRTLKNRSESEIHDKRIRLRGDDEIALECGESMLLLKRDGTVILKGVRITSRARKTQKVKGASVHIN